MIRIFREELEKKLGFNAEDIGITNIEAKTSTQSGDTLFHVDKVCPESLVKHRFEKRGKGERSFLKSNGIKLEKYPIIVIKKDKVKVYTELDGDFVKTLSIVL